MWATALAAAVKYGPTLAKYGVMAAPAAISLYDWYNGQPPEVQSDPQLADAVLNGGDGLTVGMLQTAMASQSGSSPAVPVDPNADDGFLERFAQGVPGIGSLFDQDGSGPAGAVARALGLQGAAPSQQSAATRPGAGREMAFSAVQLDHYRTARAVLTHEAIASILYLAKMGLSQEQLLQLADAAY